jgi:hypothetical protein
MTRNATVAVVARELAVDAPTRPRAAVDGSVAALRQRLAGSAARDHAVLDFLEADLREARVALAAVAAYVTDVEAALTAPDPTQERFLSLALGGGPVARLENLATVLAGVRRRLAQVAARM